MAAYPTLGVWPRGGVVGDGGWFMMLVVTPAVGGCGCVSLLWLSLVGCRLLDLPPLNPAVTYPPRLIPILEAGEQAGSDSVQTDAHSYTLHTKSHFTPISHSHPHTRGENETNGEL